MSVPAERFAFCDPIWSALRAQALELAEKEPSLASLAHATILNHQQLEDALSYHLARKVGSEEVSAMLAREVFDEALQADLDIGEAVRADLSAVFERDAACHSYVEAFLFFKGFHALQCHRISHWLWLKGRTTLARFLQSRVSELFAVDIHPAARIGRGIMMDHATGIVIGETAVVEDDVSMLHGVTLGGSGKEKGDRHPKIRRGVLLSAGARVLGNIEVGEYSRVGAGSVVIHPVPAHCTVAGVPARVIGRAGSDRPSQTMDQCIEMRESEGK
ncbi:MAG TPA: serine O-acetyltransferase [Rhizomicrobium sp.]|jgi:serine O-acetyltransferase|nr:serine O-acetyltransferase [Rhizomicrobium sp.]